MSNTWSAKPFVSFDGLDENGQRAEVKVVMGFGNPDSIESSKAGNSFKVSFAVDNTKYPPSGWAPDGSNVLDKIKEAKDAGQPIHFRIETRRKKGIDRTTPIAELSDLAHAKDGIHKSIAAVKFEGDENWTISSHAVTRIDEDPKGGGGTYSAYDNSPEELKGTSESNSDSSAYQHNSFEPPNFVGRLENGGVNPGSLAVAVPLNLLAFVNEWDREHADDPTSQVGDKKRVGVAKAMMAAANELQIKIFDGALDSPDLATGSHTRAQALVFEVTRSNYPLGAAMVQDKEALIAWKEQVVEKALAMWKWSMGEADNFIK